MRSLKPIDIDTAGVLISTDVKDEIDSKINTLHIDLNNLTTDVEDLSTEVNKRNITKERVTADFVNTTNLTVNNTATITHISTVDVMADSITTNQYISTPLIRVDEITADDTTTHILHADEIVSSTASVEDITSDKITSTEITSDILTSTDAKTDTFTSNNASIGNATIGNLGTPTTFEAGEVITNKLTARKADIEQATIEVSEEVKARIKTLVNQTKAFNDDLTDANQYIVLGEPNDGSDGADDPRYIKIPNISSGWYRLEVRDDTEILFSLIYSNAETTPIVHYSKKHAGDLTHLYYDAHTDTLWVETYASGYIYWASDSRGPEYAPETYTELDLDMTDARVYSFNTTRKHQWVLMGNHTAEYALSVQGLIEADIIKSNGDLKLAHFYGNDSLELLHFVQGYFAHEDDTLTDYQQAEVTGYVYHTLEQKDIPDEYLYVYKYKDELYDENLNPVEIPEGATLVQSHVFLTLVRMCEGKMYKLQPEPDPAGDHIWIDHDRPDGWDYQWYENIYEALGLDEDTLRAIEPETVYEYRYLLPRKALPYRDYDQTKCEALEKVRLIDDTTIVLTVDSDYGQDDITLDYSDGEYGMLPFVLGFTFRSKESDYLLNLDNFKGDASVLEDE